MTTITRARIHSTASLVLCDLARARRRAGITLARVHGNDEVWCAALARDHFRSAQEKWSEFLAATGEPRALARYEFLADFDAWIHAFSAPQAAEGSESSDIMIAGMFGTDAILVSVVGTTAGRKGRKRGNKLYRILRNDSGKHKFPPLLRLPQTESLFLPNGEEAVPVETSDEQDDRIICGYDSLLVVAMRIEGALRFRVVAPGEKLFVSPFFLAQVQDTFVSVDKVLRQAKAAMRALTPEFEVASRRKTRIYRCTPTTELITSKQPKPDSEPTGVLRPAPRTTTEQTIVLPDSVMPSVSSRLVADKLLEANAALLEGNDPGDMRPSIGTALRLSESTVLMIPGDLMAVEAVAKEVSERTASVEEQSS